VPASSANLGPGFDTLGLALARYDELELFALANTSVRVRVSGEGAATAPDDDHLVITVLRRALDLVGAPQMGFDLVCENRIPHGRGLGSSAAAVVAGIVLARTLIAEPEALSDEIALRLACEFEGHPDNAAPALLGGATIAWLSSGGARAVRYEVMSQLDPVVLIPTSQLVTRQARAALPTVVPHVDATHAAAHSALLVHAMSRDLTLLFEATEDRLHQQYRAAVMPETFQLVRELRAEGVAATISGAGPSVLVLTHLARSEQDLDICHRVVQQTVDHAHWRMLRPGVAVSGATGEQL